PDRAGRRRPRVELAQRLPEPGRAPERLRHPAGALAGRRTVWRGGALGSRAAGAGHRQLRARRPPDRLRRAGVPGHAGDRSVGCPLAGAAGAAGRRGLRRGDPPDRQRRPRSGSSAAPREARLTRGRFIVLEGVDGCGSTTHAERLAERLRARQQDVLLTCEPSSGPVGRLLREALEHRLVDPVSGAPQRFSWATYGLLFAADRVDHAQSVIVPALEKGTTIVCDRYD